MRGGRGWLGGVGRRSAGCAHPAFPPLAEPSQKQGEIDPHMGSLLLSRLPWATGACFDLYERGDTRLAITHSRRIFRGFNPRLIFLLYCFHRFLIVFHLEKIGKQPSFPRQVAYDVLCTISSASQRNSTLEVDLRRTRKNVAVLASRLREAEFIIRIPSSRSSRLSRPYRLYLSRLGQTWLMDPPASQEGPDPAPDSPRPPPPEDLTPLSPLLSSADPGTPVPLILFSSPRPP